jgi:hypothetical protein
LERAGFCTASLSVSPKVTARVRPPRVLQVPGPRGTTVGPAHDRAEQLKRVTRTLRLIDELTDPGIVTLD